MILGIGVDLLDIRRIEATLARFDQRFCHRIFTAHERERCDRRLNRAASYAQRYAAKEACSKALGTGFRQGVAWRNIEVDNLPSGKPFLRLDGGARRRLEIMTPPGMIAKSELTLTDEYPFAQATVIFFATFDETRDRSLGAP